MKSSFERYLIPFAFPSPPYMKNIVMKIVDFNTRQCALICHSVADNWDDDRPSGSNAVHADTHLRRFLVSCIQISCSSHGETNQILTLTLL